MWNRINCIYGIVLFSLYQNLMCFWWTIVGNMIASQHTKVIKLLYPKLNLYRNLNRIISFHKVMLTTYSRTTFTKTGMKWNSIFRINQINNAWLLSWKIITSVKNQIKSLQMWKTKCLIPYMKLLCTNNFSTMNQ